MLSHGEIVGHDPIEASTVVVGGGISGLATADELSRAGRDVVVLEATDRVGGRLRSFVDGDDHFDLGASWIWPNEPLVADLVRRLGVATFPSHLDGVAVFDDGESVRRLDHNPLDVVSSRFVGGANALALALADELPAGVVHMESPVDRITADGTQLIVHTPAAIYRADDVVLALPPALAVASVRFDPPLPSDLQALAAATPVWMGGSTKVVAVYDTPFWRAEGLAGSAMSYVGPLREIHDLSPPSGAGALFGFAPAGPAVDPDAVRAQLGRLFGANAASPRRIEMVDWSSVTTTSPPGALALTNYRTYGHPRFHDTSDVERIHWVATETAPSHPGHIEGALESAHRTAQAIENRIPA